jgi:Domain of unknown function (DUF1707)
MSPSSTQQWTRRIRYSDQHIRVSDAERNSVAELLGQHYADGRLDQAEFDDRVSRTMAAKTRGDLTGLFDDLPETETGAGAGGPRGPVAPSAPYRVSRRRGGGGLVRPLLLLALLFICANVAWHALTSWFFFQPFVWAFFIAAAIVVIARLTRRHDR